LLDVGCGPGYAALDLAEIVGPSGQIVAMDRSRRFLDALDAARRGRSLDNLNTLEVDLDEADLPAAEAHGAWVRWVFAFVKRPRDLLARVAWALKPGGVLVLHEYFAYSTWRLAPPLVELEEFVNHVMAAWRADGGEPDIGLYLPQWLEELDFQIKELRPIVDVVPPSNFVWEWPKTFLQVGLRQLVELGQLTSEAARSTWQVFEAREKTPHTLMITPAVLEIIAVRKGRSQG
jgi:SAM-dependent methyltransferase